MNTENMTIDERIAAVRDLPRYDMNALMEVMLLLRSEKGCPWDREQTHQSIRADFLEECYEAIEAIDCDDPAMLREELGDVLLQVVFHACIEQEQQRFTFEDICDELARKLIVRHPHVFGNVTVSDSGEVLKNWDAIKKQTKSQETYTDTLDGVCKALPALMYAQKLGKRASRAGMDWDSAKAAFGCVRTEADELEAAMQSGNAADIEEELGDLLFSCVNTARHLGIDAENALRSAALKFKRRFAATEELVLADGKQMPDLSLEVLDTYWAKAKSKEKH